MQKRKTKVLIVAGEASGDTHAAKLVNALREVEPDREFEFFGSAGPKMRDSGVEAIVRADELSVVGLAEIGKALPMFVRTMKALRSAAANREAEVAILVDFPEFNLKLAKHLKKQGIKAIYYVSPQLWAWRQYRISTIKKYVDLMITILPFEKGWYADRGVTKVEYVGSPLAKEVHASRPKEEFCRDHGLDPSRPIISLLPGSRGKEISRILPELLETAPLMPDVQFVVAVNKKLVRRTKLPANAILVNDETYDALNASDAAAVASGTATLEAGIIGTPMAVVYRTSRLNYTLFEPMIDVPHYGLINLIAEKRLCAEFIQDDLTPANLKAELERLLSPSANREMRRELKAVTEKLGHGGASMRAAEAITRELAK